MFFAFVSAIDHSIRVKKYPVARLQCYNFFSPVIFWKRTQKWSVCLQWDESSISH